MSDEFDPLRSLQPDRVRPDDPGDPAVVSRQKERLMSMIDETDREVAPTYRTPGIYPRLAYSDERAGLAYLVRVFGLTEIREARMEHGDHMLAWLRLGEGLVMVGHANHDVHHIYSPKEVGHTTTMVNVYVHDVDAHYAHAVAEGADVTMTLQDAFYGDRVYEATDLEGHRWHFAERFEAIRARGGSIPEDA
jgi:uncharacterized glyoxalase superfamily protein PhnB